MPDGSDNRIGDPPTFETLKDRRATVRASAYWLDKCHDGDPPTLTGLGLPDVDEIGSHNFLLKCDADPGLSVFILSGDAVQTDLGGRPIGATLKESVPIEIAETLCMACAEAVVQEKPVFGAGSYKSESGKEVLYRTVFMPVRSSDLFDTGYVFGAFSSNQSHD